MSIQKQPCIICNTEIVREYHPSRERIRNKCNVCRGLYQHYKITRLDRDEMMRKQNNSCAICKASISFGKNKGSFVSGAVDHCHQTGKVRGLLCASCNNGLGRFKDSILHLENAIKYLKEN